MKKTTRPAPSPRYNYEDCNGQTTTVDGNECTLEWLGDSHAPDYDDYYTCFRLIGPTQYCYLSISRDWRPELVAGRIYLMFGTIRAGNEPVPWYTNDSFKPLGLRGQNGG
jgi:hypothetical protein